MHGLNQSKIAMRLAACVVLFAGQLLLSQASVAASESDTSGIKKTYNAWLQATNAKDIEKWSSFLAPAALFLPPGVPPLETEDAILDYYRDLFADLNFDLDCELLAVDVARAGDMAWARGVCRATFTDSEGHKANGKSRWFKIWLKQPDGSWKCRLNTWNYEDG